MWWELFFYDPQAESLASAVGKAKTRCGAETGKTPNTVLLRVSEASVHIRLLGLKVIAGDGTPGTLILSNSRQFALGYTSPGFRAGVLDPKDYFDSTPDPATVRQWRMTLKAALLLGKIGVNRQVKCYCGAAFGKAGCHLHEGIVYRGQAAGTDWQWRIFSSVNCILLCAKCNTSHANVPSRQEVYERKCKELGKETVDRWLNSLPTKIPLPLF